MKARDPYGNRWTVRRRWAPWADYFRAPLNRLNRPLGNEVEDHWSGVAATMGRATSVPLLGALLAWIGLLVLWPFAALTRLVLRRPGPVEVRRAGELWRSEQVPFSAGAATISRLIDDISYNRIPPRTARGPDPTQGPEAPNSGFSGRF